MQLMTMQEQQEYVQELAESGSMTAEEAEHDLHYCRQHDPFEPEYQDEPTCNQ